MTTPSGVKRAIRGTGRLERGVYRVIYRVNEETETVEVVRIDHRSRVYRSS